ncbi:MAG: methyltransferase domain-containing protein [Paracoccaceae bacterium]
MSDADKKFTGSIPDLYDQFVVPLIFAHYAQDMAGKVAEGRPGSVLETAAGSGVVTRALAPLLAGDARYIVTDLNQPMLDRARRRQPADDRIEWRQADAMALPFGDDSFDALCCQFGVMFLPDKPAGYREAARVLRKGGRFVFNVWDRIEENAFAQSVTATAARLFPDDPPLFLARTPHGYHDARAICHDLKAAGFVGVEWQTITGQSRADSAATAAFALCQGTPLRNELEAREPGGLDRITAEAAADIRAVFGAGPVSGKMQAHVFVALK